MWIYDFAFWCEFGKMAQIHVLGGPHRLLLYYIGGVIEIYYNITRGGSSRFITILQWGGVSRDPKFVLRNIWTVPYGSKLTQHNNVGCVMRGRKEMV